MTEAHPQIVRDAIERQLLRTALIATTALAEHGRWPLRQRWKKHQRELIAALANMEARLEP